MSSRISVIIPAYNHARALPACLESIFAQTLPPAEIIVVNDGSTDSTLAVLEAYRDRVTVLSQENGGAPKARNAGFARSTGDLVIFCDADVVMTPRMLQAMHDALVAHSSAAFAYSGFRFGRKTFAAQPFSVDALRDHNLAHTTSLVRRTAFPGFDESVKRLQDWDLWLMIAERGGAGVAIDDVLFTVQIDGASRIGSSWLPRFLYYLPWHLSPWTPKQIKKYFAARDVIRQKHHLV